MSYHRLFSNFYKIFNVVVLMLLKSSKQHVIDFVFVITSFLAFSFLLLIKLNLINKSRS